MKSQHGKWSSPWMDVCEKMSLGHKVLRACCQGNITAVLWCVFILSASSPRAGAPLTTVLPAGSLRRIQCIDTNRHRHADTHTQTPTYTHTHTHTITFRKLTACSRSQVKCCFASPSLRPLPPLLSSPPLSSSLWLPRTRRPTVQWDTIYHRRNNYWRRFIVRKFQANSSPPSLSLYLPPPALSLPSVFLSCPPAIPSFFPSLFLSTLPLCMARNELYCRSDSH